MERALGLVLLEEGSVAESLVHLEGVIRKHPGDVAALHGCGNALHRLGRVERAADILSCLDLVIACDTALAHLAGALGRPTWLLLNSVSDWRWMERRADTPWYPSMRLYRQEHAGRWAEPIGRVASDLACVVAEHAASPARKGGSLRPLCLYRQIRRGGAQK